MPSDAKRADRPCTGPRRWISPIGSQQRTDARHDRCVAGTGTGEMGAVDGIAEWTRAQRRVIEVVEGLSAEQAEVRVPACPDWRVRDLFAHMVGLGVDVVDGDEPDDHNAAWTERQVRQRRDHDLAALIAEWESVAEPLREWMRANGIRPLGDVIIHEQDLRGALGRPAARTPPAWTPSGTGSRLGSGTAPPRCPRSRCWATAGSGFPEAPRTTRRWRCAPATSTWPGRWSPDAPPRSCGPGRCAATSPSTCPPSPPSGHCPMWT